MKIIALKVGDKLRVLRNNPFHAPLRKGQLVRVIGFNAGNSSPNATADGPCPYVEAYSSGVAWYTDLKELFHHFKKETK